MYGDRETFIFPVQLTTSRIGNFSRLMHTRLYVMTMMLYLSSQQLSRVVRTPDAATVPPDRIKDLDKRSKIAKKGILPPPLRLFRKLAICCQFNSSSRHQFRHRHTSHHARHRFRAIELDSLGNHQIEIYSLKALADGQETTQRQIPLAARPNDMAGKHRKEERGKIPLLQVLRRENLGGKAEPELRALRSQQAGTGVKAPGQPTLLNEGIQQTVGDGCVHADGNSKLRGASFRRAIIEMKPEKNT